MTDQDQRPSDIVELVKASKAGDKTAFGRLVRLHQRQAMRLATGVLGDAHDAAEVVQEAFVRAYLRLDRLRLPGRFGSWLLRVVAHEAIDRRRALRRRADGLKPSRWHEMKRPGQGPEEAAQDRDLRAAVKEAMSRLTDKEAKAITLFGLDGLSQREVAQMMGCSTEAVRWHVYRARQKLRVLLKEYLE
ncbi:MAG: sigma-70 family RNA polymerase sigma factor [Sedimentisphaerales bacterium]|nr:sigma-70 family RNA polymerase sigma factor [Sedimentisphaerales bacterium]